MTEDKAIEILEKLSKLFLINGLFEDSDSNFKKALDAFMAIEIAIEALKEKSACDGNQQSA